MSANIYLKVLLIVTLRWTTVTAKSPVVLKHTTMDQPAESEETAGSGAGAGAGAGAGVEAEAITGLGELHMTDYNGQYN